MRKVQISMSPTRVAYADGTTPRICIMGAGVSGLCAAAQLKRKLNLTSFVVFEKANEVGGVWLANTYPGCQVDIPGWTYSYSFAQNPAWSKLCPDQAEILEYLKGVAKRYGIYPHIKFNTEVLSTIWKEETATWVVSTVRRAVDPEEEQVHEFDAVILAPGPLSFPNYPAIFDNFSGPKMHSGEWDHSVKLEGRVVGVVGSSASAIQVIPSIALKVKELIVYTREPTNVIPKAQFPLGWVVRRLFTLFPFLLWIARAICFFVFESLVPVYNAGSCAEKTVRFLCSFHLKRNVKDENLRRQLTPNHRPGQRLLTVGYSSYLQTFNLPNVQLNRSRISKCEGTTIVAEDGSQHSLDVLILCTGFVNPLDVQCSSFRVIGANGVNLLELWRSSRPDTFCGITCNVAPNFFFLLGPNSLAGSNGSIFAVECQVRVVLNAIRALVSRNATSVRVTPSAQSEYMNEVIEAAKSKVYMQAQKSETGNGGTFLVNVRGHPLLWPKSSTSYWLRTRRLDPSNFEFTGEKVKNQELGQNEAIEV